MEPISRADFNGLDQCEVIPELLIMDVADKVWTIEVTNASTGAKVGEGTTDTGECQFYISKWTEGVYLVMASDGKDVISKKITIK